MRWRPTLPKLPKSATSAVAWGWTAAGALVTAVWLAGAVVGDWLPLDVDVRAGAAATAVAAVVTATWAPRTDAVEWLFASGLALVALPTATALGLGEVPDGSLAGVVLLVAGGWPTAPRLARVLVVPGVALAVAAGSGTAVVVAAGAAAIAAALWSGAFALPLGLLAVAVAPVPGARPAAYLLAAAAVLAAADDDQGGAVAVLALPGAVAAALAIAAGPVSASRAAATVAMAAVAGLATTHPPADRPTFAVGPAAVLAAWLLVAPGTWSWVGEARLGHYDRGAALALAAVAIAAVAHRVWPRPVPSNPELP